jgi:L-seryl-tRNA(Ser) seleniumtransferase
VLDEDLGCAAVQRPHGSDRCLEVFVRGPTAPPSADEQARPERLRQHQDVAWLGAALPEEPVGCGDADDRESVLRLRVADGVATGKDAPGRTNPIRGAIEDRPERRRGHVLRDCRDRQREQHSAAHREHIGQGVRSRDLAERPRVVDDRREEVERADDGDTRRDEMDRRIIGWIEPRDQTGRAIAIELEHILTGTETGQRLAQDVGAELGSAAAAARQLGQPHGRDVVVEHALIIGAASAGPGTMLRRSCASAERGRAAEYDVAGAEGSRWAPSSSKRVARRSASRGGFDSHALPPYDRAMRPPSVDAVLRAAAAGLDGSDPAAMTALAREVIAEERAALAAGAPARSAPELAEAMVARVREMRDPAAGARGAGLEPVINATGVILHTNLGRAAWPQAAIAAAAAAAAAPSLLELDRETGRRGRRFSAVEDEVIALTGAEDALVVNNNAAAVALAVGLAGRGGVAVSRGELVEIGGGVRIPDVIRRAGARLVEVGTTNRTRVADFESALDAGRTKVVLRVHPSNFAQTGFVEAPDPVALAAAAHRHGAIVVDDLGSGALLDTSRFGLAHEPMPAERLATGADLVTFSGDKLVGGPQAGIIAGRRDLVERLRRDPLARAMRPDKVVLAALAATLRLYRAGTAHVEIPVWRQIATPVGELERRARALVAGLARDRVRAAATESTIGGGSLPGQVLPSWSIRVEGGVPDRLLRTLRAGTPAVVGRIVDDAVVLDLRTVDPIDDDRLVAAIGAAIG